jgi:F-type H+-transporting ATPase subunit delta
VTTSSKARTYASVIFETALKEWQVGLGTVSTALAKSPGVRSKLADQTVNFKEKQDILMAVLPGTLSTAAPVRNFLLGMLSNGDITLLEEVVDELNHLAAAAGGPRAVPAEITSAVELTSEERLAIQNRLIDQHGANLEFKFIVDPAILGGLVVRVGDKLLDTSVASRMAALRQSLGVASAP